MRIFEPTAAWLPAAMVAAWEQSNPGDPRRAEAPATAADLLPPLSLVIEEGTAPRIALRGYATAEAAVMGVGPGGRPFARRIVPRDGSAAALADAARTQVAAPDAPLPPDLGACADAWASVAAGRLAPDIPPPSPPRGGRALGLRHVKWHARTADPARAALERRLRIAAARVYAPAERLLRAALDPERLRRADLLVGQDGWPPHVLDAYAALMAAEDRHGPEVAAAIDVWPWFAAHAIELAPAIRGGAPDHETAATILARLGAATDPCVLRRVLPWFAENPIRTVEDRMRAPFIPFPPLDLLAIALESGLDPGTLGPDEWYRIKEGVEYRLGPATAASAQAIDILAKAIDAATVALDQMCGVAMPPAFACGVLEALTDGLSDAEVIQMVAGLATGGDRASVLARISATGRDPHALAGAAAERMSRTHDAARALEEHGGQLSWDVRGRRSFGTLHRALHGAALVVTPQAGAGIDVWRLSDPQGSLVRHADAPEVAAAAFAVLARAAGRSADDPPNLSGHAAMRAAHLAHVVGAPLGLQI